MSQLPAALIAGILSSSGHPWISGHSVVYGERKTTRHKANKSKKCARKAQKSARRISRSKK